jgi:predicted methyltransferase
MRMGWILAAVAVLAAGASVARPKVDYAAILADPIRPDADRVRDPDRKPAEVVAFSGVRPGDKVAELAPGGGYFTSPESSVPPASSTPSAARPRRPCRRSPTRAPT